MTIIYSGIRRDLTDLLNDYGKAEYAQNVRFTVLGELQRRPGFGKSTMARLAGPVVLITGGFFKEPYIIQVTNNGTVTTTRAPLLIWGDPPLWPPPPPDPPACALWAPVNATGSESAVVQKTFPVDACAGQVVMTGIEPDGRRDPYGYQFVITADNVVVYTSACIENDSETYNLPAGTRVLSVAVNGGCSGGADPGTWTVDII